MNTAVEENIFNHGEELGFQPFQTYNKIVFASD